MDQSNSIKVKSKWIVNHRVVHLDLKGAPPKISYLIKIIPLFRQWGATGVLVEYEDMFPYQRKLSILSKKNSYNSDEIRSLQEVVKAEGMIFIPLLQSFGHVEFILKKKEFSHLREATLNPMSLCPTHKESLPLIEEIIDQYVLEHNELEYIHIGGDEVFCMGLCKNCVMTKQTHEQLYISHMMPLIKLIENKYPKLKIMVWDDMFREFSISNLESLGSSIIPMVWSYVDDLNDQFPSGMWQRYSDVFDEIWFATSFKGSNGPLSNIPPLQHHVNNHLSWITLYNSFDEQLQSKIKGTCITGWSRYDHFATLCELLPVSLPCLALCLHVLKEQVFTKEIHAHVSNLIGYANLIPFSTYFGVDISCGNFPGSELILYVSQLEIAKSQHLAAEHRIEAWMDSWHVEVLKEINIGHLEYAAQLLNQAIHSYDNIRNQLLECLSFHFYEDTICEFVKVKLEDGRSKCLSLLAKIESVKQNKNIDMK